MDIDCGRPICRQVDGLVLGSCHAHTGDMYESRTQCDTTRHGEAAMDPVPESPLFAGRADGMLGDARGQPLNVTSTAIMILFLHRLVVLSRRVSYLLKK